MVNLGLNWSSLLGIVLAIAGAGLYFLRTWRPKLARDHDIFFAAVGLLCGGILLFQGWRLDPILAFGQFLLTGSAIFFAAESISLRGVATQQAKSRAPVVDEDRPVSQAYSYVEAELDELEPVEEYPANRRIRGAQEPRSSRSSSYEDEYGRRPPARGSIYDRSEPPQERPRRRPRPESSDWDVSTDPEPRRRPSRSREDWDASRDTQSKRTSRPRSRDAWESSTGEEEKYGRSTRSSGDVSATTYPEARTRRTRARSESSGTRSDRDVASTSTDYVEYRPVESPEEEFDNSSNFDK